ncbi:MAG: tetratricopeptide repeat protein [Bacteroidaceae bacterium]|nr:tetratricopeptide repeat protein [Bacteroidaceae bacterium]
MKKYLIIFLLTLPLTSLAQKRLKALRALPVSVIAYDNQNNMRQGQGVRVGENGTIVTEYDMLKGASRAVVIDQAGTESEVKTLEGASSLYNVAKINTGAVPKNFTVPEIYQSPMKVGDVVFILPPYNADKKAVSVTDTIKKVETFKEQFYYYTLTKTHKERFLGGTVVNEDGQLVGTLQAASQTESPSFVMDIHYPLSLSVNAINAKNMDLTAIDLPLQMPTTEDNATAFLFFADRTNKARYEAYIRTFIQRFPQSATGYTTLADYYLQDNAFARADSVYEVALQQEGLTKDEIHYSRSKAAYTLCTTPQPNKYDKWTAAFALSEAQEANKIRPLPTYTLQEANSLYLLKEYQQACDKYVELTKTNLRSADLFMYAALCRQAIDQESDKVLALMDSAVACYGKPLPSAAAPIVLTRGKTLAQAGKPREAVKDYNEYEHLMAAQLPADFYYERSLLETKGRMYPAALSDIERAISIEPQEPIYYAEAAALNYRIGEHEQTIKHAEKAIALDPQFADAYRILGVCHKQKGNAAKAKETLQKAKDLGDELAGDLLKDIK